MKSLKGILAALVISILFGLSGVAAKGESLTLAEITLPKKSGVYTSDRTKNKTEKGLQHIRTASAVDKWSGDGRAVLAQVVGPKGEAEWMLSPKGQLVSWTSSNSKVVGSYYLKLKARKSTLSTVSYSGTWYLDNAIVDNN